MMTVIVVAICMIALAVVVPAMIIAGRDDEDRR